MSDLTGIALDAAIEKSQKMWGTLPDLEPHKLPGDWCVVRLNHIHARARVAIIKPDKSAMAVVWADKWRQAFAVVKTGADVPEDCRAPAYGY